MAPSANGDSLIKATIIENVWLSEKYYRISFEVPAGYLKSFPGQFVMLRVDLRQDPLLGRPFSIYSVYKNGSLGDLLCLVQGRGENDGPPEPESSRRVRLRSRSARPGVRLVRLNSAKPYSLRGGQE